MPVRLLLIPLFIGLNISSILGQDTPDEASREVLSPQVNSSHVDARPMIGPKGEKFYFCRRFHPGNVNGTRDGQDIWVANIIDGEFKNAYNIGAPLNNKRENAIASISPDGTEMILFNTYYWLFKNSNSPISKTKLTGNSWSEPEDITINDYSNENDYVDFYRSYDPDVLLMAIEKKPEEGNHGDQDLYVSFPEGENTWSTPQNLGATINTSNAEFAPFLGKKGERLFFVSMGHRGLGGADIYYSERLDDSWQNWSEPENLGKPINSNRQETYFSIDSDYSTIYFESYKQGAEDRDIFKATLPEKFRPEPEPAQDEEIAREDDTLTATNTGSNEKSPVAGTNTNPNESNGANNQENTNLNKEENSQQENSGSVASLNESANTNTNTDKEQYTAEENEHYQEQQPEGNPEDQTAQTAPSPEITSNINNTLRHVKVQEKGGNRRIEILRNIYFDYNQTNIRKEYHQRLQKIASLLRQHPQMKIEINGFADDVGARENNVLISERRAKKVGEFIRDQYNLDPDRFIYKALGEKFPLATNDDEQEGRELNRRVEIVIIVPSS